jgi:hypothetical protein
VATVSRSCPECGSEPDDKHASWCLAETSEFDAILGNNDDDEIRDVEDDPLAD